MLVCDLRRDDPRVAVLEELRLPAVVIGRPGGSGALPSVWSDDAAVDGGGGGIPGRARATAASPGSAASPTARTPQIRTEAFAAVCRRLGLAEPVTVSTDYTGEEGARATRRLLGAADRPTAIIYDNDVMAVAGLAVAQEMGLSVPGDLSIVAWDDSPLCRLVHPPLTALTRDIAAYGAHAARLLLAAIAGEPVASAARPPAHLTPAGQHRPAAPR